MSAQTKFHPLAPSWRKSAAILAMIFGVMTIVSGGSVLFGGESARLQAGDVVPFVLWFNFAAGFFYVIAGLGIWRDTTWAFPLAFAIAAATLVVAAIFTLVALLGTAFEMRTVAALILRFSIWAGISILIRPRKTGP